MGPFGESSSLSVSRGSAIAETIPAICKQGDYMCASAIQQSNWMMSGFQSRYPGGPGCGEPVSKPYKVTFPIVDGAGRGVVSVWPCMCYDLAHDVANMRLVPLPFCPRPCVNPQGPLISIPPTSKLPVPTSTRPASTSKPPALTSEPPASTSNLSFVPP